MKKEPLKTQGGPLPGGSYLRQGGGYGSHGQEGHHGQCPILTSRH